MYINVNKQTNANQNTTKIKQNTKNSNMLITKHTTNKKSDKNLGRINIDISDDLEKQLRLKTVERFGGKKCDLSRAVQDAVKTWINKQE